MITFEKTLNKARALKSVINECTEYTDAFMFKNKADRFSIGGEGACVILKETGQAINQLAYFEMSNGKEVRTFDI